MKVILHLGFGSFLAVLGVIWAAVMAAICVMQSKAYDAEYEEVEE